MEQIDVDVAVVGSGGAGVTAAVAAQAAGARVLLLSTEPVGSGDTRIADGRIAFPSRLPGDSPETVVADMLKAGADLNREDLVWALAQDGWQAVQTYEQFGILCERGVNGELGIGAALRRGGHSTSRTYQIPGAGVAIGSGLRAAAARAGVPVLEGVVVSEILLTGGQVSGLAGLRLNDGAVVMVRCGAVVLATGSAGWLYYPHTDCVRANTGAGYVLALRAGARLLEMEQVQFIPFGLAAPKSMLGLLLGEGAIAGPHGVLKDGDGRLRMTELHRKTRAVIARAMAEAMHEGRTGPNGGVYLDLTPNLEHEDGRRAVEWLQKNGTLALVRRAYGKEAAACREPWEMLPTAHYNMGGVLIDAKGDTGVPGLYAAGAVSGGLHGGNRLGSMGLTESIVFGLRAGRAAAATVAAGRPDPTPAMVREAADRLNGVFGRSGTVWPVEVVRRLQTVMWEHCGLGRTAAGLEQALQELDRIEAGVATVRTPADRAFNGAARDLLDLHLMLPSARAIVMSAATRRESRGAHFRLDYPEQGPRACHMIVSATRRDEQLELAVTTEPVRREALTNQIVAGGAHDAGN